jgi:MFS family permease
VVRFAEGFDQAAYLLAAVWVFPAVFFPYSSELLGAAYGLALFGLGFAARPAGRWAASWAARRCGRTAVLGVAGVLLGLGTAAVGWLPGYAAAATMAVLLLVACRAVQGLAWGACANLHPASHDASAFVGVIAGALAATGLMGLIASQLVHADFAAWGWRYPFCIAIAIQMVALFARFRIGPQRGA